MTTTIVGARGRKGRLSRAGQILSLLVPLAAALAPSPAGAQTCGLPAGGTLTGIVNSYYPGVGTAAAGATSISVGTRRGSATNIASGDVLLVIQMQDADINSNNSTAYGANNGTARGSTATNSAGLYEYVVATSAVTGGAVSIVGNGTGGANTGLMHTYRTAAFGTQGQRRFQVVRVPQYSTATLSSTLTASRWNGATGGILAIDVADTLTLGGTVSLDGLGFRAAAGRELDGDTTGPTGTDYRSLATDNAHGGKGEGIAGTPEFVWDGRAGTPAVIDTGVDGYPNGSLARGAPGNAGGGGTDPHVSANDENSGGGGGGNAGIGGIGGNSWSSNLATGGIGGAAYVTGVDHLILGGGGGAGDRNDCGPGHGGNGGGIVIMRIGQAAGTGAITAKGDRGYTSGQDGAGGGGGGGRIVVVAAAGNLNTLTTDVSGGTGGYTNLNTVANGGVAPDPQPTCMQGTSHGPGGGGGGGAIYLSDGPTTPATMLLVTGGASGLTNVVAGQNNVAGIAYGAGAGGAGSSSTTVVLADIPGEQPCTFLTRASVCGLRVDPSGTVEFATSNQRGTLAFELYAASDASGRHGRVALTEKPIPAPMHSSDTPILYRAETGPITTPYLVVEEIEVGGRRHAMGPFKVGDERLRLRYERTERWNAEHQASARAGARVVSSRRRAVSRAAVRGGFVVVPLSPIEGLKVEVSGPGPVRVTLAELEDAGLPIRADHRPPVLRLTNMGVPVPFQLVSDTTGAVGLEFTAQELATDYSGQNAYIVTWDQGVAPVPTVPFTTSGFKRKPNFVRVEQNAFNAAFVAQGSDPWIWDLLVAGVPAGPYAFDLPGLLPPAGPVAVHIGLVGGSEHAHTVVAAINGQAAGSLTFSGKNAAVLKGTIPASTLRASGNELSLTYTAAGGDPESSLLFLDVLDLKVAVAPPGGFVPIDGIVAYDASLPADAGGDYLIVTHAAFAEQARRIAALKEAEGHGTWVVDVDRAYDRFSGGVMEPAAVHALIRQAAARGVRYVLLIGDDTFDPRDFSGTGQVSYVPSLLGWDGEYGRVPSENLYADVDGDGSPDVAIGRLPVQTAEEADLMVDKIARQAEVLRQAGTRHLFVVDNQELGDPSFTNEAGRAAALLGGAAQISWADVAQGVDQARADVVNGIAAGPLATHYFGHGGADFWADEHVFDAVDAAALPETGHETLLFSWTCVSQNYLYGFGPSLSEALLLTPRAGALAAVGPTGITDSRHQAVLFSYFYRALMRGVPLGEAMRRAKAHTLRVDPAARPVVEGWSLLGDPALTLPPEVVQR